MNKYKKFRRFLLVPVTACFCTIAFASTLPDAVQDVALQAGDTSWLDVSSDSVTQQPLLLTRSSPKKKKDTIQYYYCEVKQEIGGGYQTRTKKTNTEDELDAKLLICDGAANFDCFVGKCTSMPSPA